ncbi:uncharacterized protein DUF1080 [Dyadobacter jejuensis]|uniref:Uncharacterized protein DUF1080 n=1 Tax=Dyadobacter jejuensis TaxID=1082580 RepID=A0A316AX60_9BACT|nr:DUF1080 domain-containing protein [Dyadobacter jejuensis]PWJ54787.1 uncharacterized protein DUF1080 [Dyadobacter jejuensis]
MTKLYLLFALLTLGWGSQAQSPTQSLFNGQDLTGWTTVNPAKMSEWSVVDSTIRSGDGIRKIPANTYLYTQKEYADFEFSCLFKIWGDASTGLINSGIQYRSIVKDGKMVGYQADIGKGYWGDIYDEHRRGKLVGGQLSTLQHVLNPEGWNSYMIRCKGPLHEIYINGVKTASYIEKDATIPQKGVIAVQIHSGGKAQVAFRDLTITEL